MHKKTLYLALTAIGAVVPMLAFVPWVAVHGLDVRLTVRELFANRISTFFALDLFITACVVVVFARLERVRGSWLVIVVMLCIGVSAALPLLLFLRERESAEESAG